MEEDTNSELWARYVNPVLAGLYAAAGLDKRFVRADGTHLEDSTGRRYLDFLAGYGSVPLGHHPAALWAVVHAAEQSREPIFSIPALLDGAGRLAEALVKAAAAEGNNNDDEAKQQRQLRFAMFANSGSEAVEWAIKLARTHTQRLGTVFCFPPSVTPAVD
jgi:4-aminobutyrate aminotransferase-like enzyme